MKNLLFFILLLTIIGCNRQQKYEDILEEADQVVENNADSARRLLMHEVTHDFKHDGECWDLISDRSGAYKSLSAMDMSLIKLQLIADYYTEGKGLSITKYSWSKGMPRLQGDIRTYGVKKGQNKRGKVVYKPIKC